MPETREKSLQASTVRTLSVYTGCHQNPHETSRKIQSKRRCGAAIEKRLNREKTWIVHIYCKTGAWFCPGVARTLTERMARDAKHKPNWLVASFATQQTNITVISTLITQQCSNKKNNRWRSATHKELRRQTPQHNVCGACVCVFARWWWLVLSLRHGLILGVSKSSPPRTSFWKKFLS